MGDYNKLLFHDTHHSYPRAVIGRHPNAAEVTCRAPCREYARPHTHLAAQRRTHTALLASTQSWPLGLSEDLHRHQRQALLVPHGLHTSLTPRGSALRALRVAHGSVEVLASRKATVKPATYRAVGSYPCLFARADNCSDRPVQEHVTDVGLKEAVVQSGGLRPWVQAEDLR